jgi:hypothetical protein
MADDKTFTKDELDAAVTKAVEAATGDVEGLKQKVEDLIGDNKKLKAEARKAKDVDPAEVERLHGEVEELQGKLTAAEKTAKDASKLVEKANKDLETEQGFTQKLLIQDGIKTALIANGVKDEDFIDSLAAKFASGAKVVTEGDDRKAVYGDKPLPDFIKEWAGSDAGKKFVAAPANGGGGAPGGTDKPGGTKTILRADFDALGHVERAAFAKEGGKVVDAAA